MKHALLFKHLHNYLFQNGLFVATPFLIMVIFKVPQSAFADFLKHRKILSVTNICKIMQLFCKLLFIPHTIEVHVFYYFFFSLCWHSCGLCLLGLLCGLYQTNSCDCFVNSLWILFWRRDRRSLHRHLVPGTSFCGYHQFCDHLLWNAGFCSCPGSLFMAKQICK